VKGGFNVIDALDKFPSVELTLGQLMTVASIITPRRYSLANDHKTGNHARFEVLCTVRSESGASGVLDRAQPGDSLSIRFAECAMKLPKVASNVLYIALGTGVGLVRAQLQRRMLAKAAGRNVGAVHLLYGHHQTGKDCIFMDEFEAMKREGLLATTYAATNDGPAFVSPLTKLSPSLVEFLGKDGEIVYCGYGGAVLPMVEAALKKAGVDTATMRATGRYHEEYFASDKETERLFKGSA
jgi:sulfite reductase alpha subunit-like flavoprotein